MAIATTWLRSDRRARAAACVTSVARGAAVAIAITVGACGGAGREVGESCDTSGECSADLQCLEQVCVPRCLGHVDCGDGSVCDDGECRPVESAIGDPCSSELECGRGQTCRMGVALVRPPGTCQPEGAGRLEGASCTSDDECRMGGCALGRCVSLCLETDECRRGWNCAVVPLPARSLNQVDACLPGTGTLEFSLPVPMAGLSPEIEVPVPSTARSLVLVFEAPTPSLYVGAGKVTSPQKNVLYEETQVDELFYANKVRHSLRQGVSVLQIPSSSAAEAALSGGLYKVTVTLRRDPSTTITGEPTLRVIEKLGSSTRLDVHFYFLDLGDHPCEATIGTPRLSAATARTLNSFQQHYLGSIETIFRAANINLGEVTYTDIEELVEDGRPDLDILDAADAHKLFAIPERKGGVSIFLVRSLPDSQQLLTNGTPGAPIPGTGASGIAIAADALCYRDWEQLARQTAHGIARHMGLFRVREPDDNPRHVDPIEDTGPPYEDNLMYWSEFGSTDLSLTQRAILRASPVLR